MSTYLNTHVEYKKDDKWHLLKTYGPYQHSTESRYENGKWITKEKEPDGVLSDGTKLDAHDSDYVQGPARDFFSPNGFGIVAEGLTGRGLPDDLSDELVAKFQKMNEEIKKNSSFGKWWYNETYCTLGELQNALDAQIEKFKSQISNYTNQIYNNKTNKKLDKILSLLDTSIKVDKNEEEFDYQEILDSLWEEDFWDLMIIHSYIYNISKDIEKYVSVYRPSDVRLILYFD